jgi:hypothetical protein
LNPGICLCIHSTRVTANLDLGLNLYRLAAQEALSGRSSTETVRGVTGSSGVLFSRPNLGIPRAIPLPLPSLHLLAGMMELYHPASYPAQFLCAVASSGRSLDRFRIRPVTPAEELSTTSSVLLQGDHLSDVVKAVANSGTTKDSAPVSDDTARMYSWELLDSSPLDPSQLLLAEPQLITAAILYKGGVYPFSGGYRQAELEKLMETAEGHVLKALVRKDLVKSLIHRLGLQGVCGQCTCCTLQAECAAGGTHAAPNQSRCRCGPVLLEAVMAVVPQGMVGYQRQHLTPHMPCHLLLLRCWGPRTVVGQCW